MFFFKQQTAYEMRISDWSSDVCSSDLGYRPGEIEPHIDIFLARVHPDDAGRVLNALAAAERSERFAVEHRVVHSDGTILHVSQVAEVIHDEAGNAIRMIGTCQAITDDKAAEQDRQSVV